MVGLAVKCNTQQLKIVRKFTQFAVVGQVWSTASGANSDPDYHSMSTALRFESSSFLFGFFFDFRREERERICVEIVPRLL